MHENMYTAKPNRQAGCAAENNLFYKYVIKRQNLLQYDEDTLSSRCFCSCSHA